MIGGRVLHFSRIEPYRTNGFGAGAINVWYGDTQDLRMSHSQNTARYLM